MGKWLAIAAALVLALLALLWFQINEPATAVASASQREAAAEPAQDPAIAQLARAAEQVREAEARGDKIDPASDAFTYAFDERVPPLLTMQAAKCYTGGINRVHRNQSVKFGYNLKIKDGKVTVHDVRVIESKISDQRLIDCFAQEIAAVTWTDNQLPDWQQEDELVISPERGMKKFTKENLEYEGDGPIGTLEAPVGPVASSREMPAEPPMFE